ncbi:type II secretion system minor pseudopilin GspK [Massilia brevitalea]|uniref:type II secretion system minor pseudopilin GspK n=1 Tax=Massilia brevitalea TaxID=442526 RepID=UPI002738DDCF|nr:type II secretion system minor pseudopilin GspK [Massilia brevitalea]
MRPCRSCRRQRQRGVAVITALLLTTLAITIVASLFWQQQVEVRSMENQRLNLQTRWILRGALDWSSVVLRQDAIDHRDHTVLTHVWATPLAETRLDQYIERERVEGEVFDATLSGSITDATSRYNLTNLTNNGRIDLAQMAILARLMTNLQMNPALAKTTANLVAAGAPPAVSTGMVDPITGQEVGDTVGKQGDAPTQANNAEDGGQGGVDNTGGVDDGSGGLGGSSGAPPQTQAVSREGIGTPIRFLEVEDLLAVKGFTPEMVEKLRPFVTVLPEATPVNVNTAPPEVLAAVIPNFSLSEANALVQRRRSAPWRDLQYFMTELGGNTPVPGSVSVHSDYFIVSSRIRLDRGALNADALIKRAASFGPGSITVVWVRQN